MTLRPDPLDALFGDGEEAGAGELFRGYISHALLFYRQGAGVDYPELRRLGRELRLGSGVATGRALGEVPDRPGWRLAAQALRHSSEQGARSLLTRAISQSPREAAFRVLRGFVSGEQSLGSRRLGAASEADFRAALELDGDQLWARMGLGMALEMRRRYVQAIAQFDAAASLAPEWSWPLVFRGVCLWYLAEFRSAVDVFGKAARLDPRGEMPLLFSARARADLRDRRLVGDLDRALRLAPDSGFTKSWRGRAMFVLRRTPEALTDLRASIRALPDYDRGWSWLGVSLVESGQPREAVDLLMKARALNPYYPTTLYPLSGALMALGRWGEASRIMREASVVDRSGVWVEHRISMSHPNPAALRSRRDLDRLLSRRPRLGWALAWRGQTELLLQNYWRALDDLSQAARLDARDPWARLWRGETLRRLGLRREAARDFAAALRLDSRLSWAHAGLGACLLEDGRARRALVSLERALRLQPRCGPAHALRGTALLAVGRPNEASAAFAEALELHPQDRWVARRLAETLALCGQWNCALEALGVRGSSDADAAFESFLLSRAGRAKESARSLREALRRNPAQPLALYLRERQRIGRLASAPNALRLLRVQDPFAAFSKEVCVRTARGAGRGACADALQRGDLQDACRSLEDADSARDGALLRLRAWLKLSCGDWPGALEDAGRALDSTLDPEDSSARLVRDRALDALRRRRSGPILSR